MGPRQYASQTNPPKGAPRLQVVILKRDQDSGRLIYGPEWARQALISDAMHRHAPLPRPGVFQ